MDPRTALFNINVDTLATICALCDAAFESSGNDNLSATTDETPLKTLAKQVYGKLQFTDVARDIFDVVQAEKATALTLGKQIAQVKQDADMVIGERERLDVMAKHMVSEPQTLEDWGRRLVAVKEQLREVQAEVTRQSSGAFDEFAGAEGRAAAETNTDASDENREAEITGADDEAEAEPRYGSSQLQYPATIGFERCRRIPQR